MRWYLGATRLCQCYLNVTLKVHNKTKILVSEKERPIANPYRPWANPRPPSPTLGILWDQFFLKPMTLIYQTCESAKKNPLVKRMAAIFQNGRRKD